MLSTAILTAFEAQRGRRTQISYHEQDASVNVIFRNFLRRQLSESEREVVASDIMERVLIPRLKSKHSVNVSICASRTYSALQPASSSHTHTHRTHCVACSHPSTFIRIARLPTFSLGPNQTTRSLPLMLGQLSARVLSYDGRADPVVLAINASSAALHAAGVDWAGPVAAVRIAVTSQSQFVVNPTLAALDSARWSLVRLCLNACLIMHTHTPLSPTHTPNSLCLNSALSACGMYVCVRVCAAVCWG